MTPIDLSKLLKNYNSGWVALSTDYKRVVAFAEKYEDLLKKIKDKKKIIVLQNFENFYNYVS